MTNAIDRKPETPHTRLCRESQYLTDASIRMLLEQVQLAREWERDERMKAEERKAESRGA